MEQARLSRYSSGVTLVREVGGEKERWKRRRLRMRKRKKREGMRKREGKRWKTLRNVH